MNKKPLENLKKLLENPESISEEQAEEMLKSSLEMLSDFSNFFENPDNKDQETLLKELQEYSKSLQQASKDLMEKNGMSQEELSKLLMSSQLPELTDDQKKAMQEIGKTMSVFTSAFMKDIALPGQKKEEKNSPAKNNNGLRI